MICILFVYMLNLPFKLNYRNTTTFKGYSNFLASALLKQCFSLFFPHLSCLIQKDLLVKHAEETEEEFLSTIKVKFTLISLGICQFEHGFSNPNVNLRPAWNISIFALLSDEGFLHPCRVSGWQSRSSGSSWRREKAKPRCNLDVIFLLRKGTTPHQWFVLMLCFVSALDFSAVLTEVAKEGGAPSTALNFAEEIELLTSSGKMEINMFDSFYRRHVRTFNLPLICEEIKI